MKSSYLYNKNNELFLEKKFFFIQVFFFNVEMFMVNKHVMQHNDEEQKYYLVSLDADSLIYVTIQFTTTIKIV